MALAPEYGRHSKVSWVTAVFSDQLCMEDNELATV
jgi:hypothetical protein